MSLRIGARCVVLLLILSAVPCEAGQNAAHPLSLMSVNLWHKDRPAELKVVAQRLGVDAGRVPDFILCQEVVFERDGHQENTAQVLGDFLGYHTRGTKRTSDREGIAIVSRYPFVHYDERHLKSQTSRIFLGFRRVSIMGEFMVPGIGRVRVVNVHFTNWGTEKRVRRNQLRETLQWIAQRHAAAPAVATFLGGDFNAEPDSDEMELMDNERPERSLRFMNFNSDKPTKGSPGNPRKRIDYIFVSAPKHGVSLLDERILWKNGLPEPDGDRFHLSDHLAVLHAYTLQSPTGATAMMAD